MLAWCFLPSIFMKLPRGYGATAARLTPDQKVGSSNLSVLTFSDALGERDIMTACDLMWVRTIAAAGLLRLLNHAASVNRGRRAKCN